MMRRISRWTARIALALAIGVGMLGRSDGVTIDFEGVAPEGGSVHDVTPYSEDGFTIECGPSSAAIFDSEFPGLPNNGTDVFGILGGDTMWIYRSGSGSYPLVPFSVESLELANLYAGYPFYSPVTVTGVLNPYNGTTVSIECEIVTDVMTKFEIGFSDILYLMVSPPNDQAQSVSIDNIVIDLGTEPVPDAGATVILLGCALGGLSGLLRKRLP